MGGDGSTVLWYLSDSAFKQRFYYKISTAVDDSDPGMHHMIALFTSTHCQMVQKLKPV